jgi:hypothetical protein
MRTINLGHIAPPAQGSDQFTTTELLWQIILPGSIINYKPQYYQDQNHPIRIVIQLGCPEGV